MRLRAAPVLLCVALAPGPVTSAAPPARESVTLPEPAGKGAAPVGRDEPDRSVSAAEQMVAMWNGRLAERVEELVHDGTEGAVLEPLARHPAAARIMLDHFRRSDRLFERKLAPALAGLLGPEAPAGSLDEIFEAEAGRRRSGAARAPAVEAARGAHEAAVNRTLKGLAGRPGVADYFDAQSVAEEVVIAGRRWCGDSRRAKAGGAILRKVVERTIGGEYWNSSGPALKGLVCDCREDAQELLTRFSVFAWGAAPQDPSRPSLLAERNAVEDLRGGRCEAPLRSLGAPQADPLAAWDPSDRALLRAFLLFAESAR